MAPSYTEAPKKRKRPDSACGSIPIASASEQITAEVEEDVEEEVEETPIVERIVKSLGKCTTPYIYRSNREPWEAGHRLLLKSDEKGNTPSNRPILSTLQQSPQALLWMLPRDRRIVDTVELHMPDSSWESTLR